MARNIRPRRRSRLRPRSRRRRLVAAALWGLAVAHVVEALALRRRRAGLAALPAPEAPAGDQAAAVPAVVTVAGAPAFDPGTRTAVAAEMEAAGLDVVDLVPADLPAERALRLLRRVDPRQVADDPVAAPGGAHEALALHPGVAERMGDVPAGGLVADRGELLRLTVRAQRYAPTAAGVRVGPGVRAGAQTPDDRWRELYEATAAARTVVSLPPVLLGAEALHLSAMGVGALVAPVAGVAALATWCAQPAVVFGGRHAGGPGGLRPPDLGQACLLRLPRRAADSVRTMIAGSRRIRAEGAARAAGPVPVPPPEEELFDPVRDACPWCGSGDLAGRLDTTDLLQGKPGRFHLDECQGCGHVFQNPALSLAGLDHYYADFYDGAGQELWEAAFAAGAAGGDPRIRAVAAVTKPRAWLDVGAGQGHFCLTARQEWPGAVFDGLDMGEAVEEAQRRGWIDTAHRGLFPELAGRLPRTYDVVSMFHYLEHTRDPRRELAAAAAVLESGGHLVVEVPDPEHPWARRLGRYWLSWLQPQHQHLVPFPAMVTALDEAGFDVVSAERGPATLGNDLLHAVCLAVQALVPSPHAPWLRPPSPAQRVKRAGLVAAAVPVALLAALLDQVKDARLGPDQPGNAYRIVARRRAHPPGLAGTPGSPGQAGQEVR